MYMREDCFRYDFCSHQFRQRPRREPKKSCTAPTEWPLRLALVLLLVRVPCPSMPAGYSNRGRVDRGVTVEARPRAEVLRPAVGRRSKTCGSALLTSAGTALVKERLRLAGDDLLQRAKIRSGDFQLTFQIWKWCC